jgi:hypothetical protein
MRKFKRIIHKQFGGVGNFFAMIILVAITVIFINTYVLSKQDRKFFVLLINSICFNLFHLASNKLPEDRLHTDDLVHY